MNFFNKGSGAPTNQIYYTSDNHIRIDHNYSLDVEKAYILSIPNNKKSLIQTKNCVQSCIQVGMDYEVFEGYDGTSLSFIKTPDHLVDKDFMKWLRVMDHKLSITETCCALGHLALWAHCMTINQPIVILEHDAVMLFPFTKLSSYNTLEYLGHKGELKNMFEEYNATSLDELISLITSRPPDQFMRRHLTSVVNHNWVFPMGLHAYAIDPIMARRLFSHVMTEGLVNPIDAIVRQDKFSVIQNGLYACQNEQAEMLSTIATKDKTSNYGRKDTYTLPGVSK
jgi:GR25 family glycosyltransferase involved in LPS biosynthesis